MLTQAKLVNPCSAQQAALNAKRDEIDSLETQLTQQQSKLSHATPQEKHGIIVQINAISNHLAQAESELPALQAALDKCLSHYSGAVGFDPDAPVVANPDFRRDLTRVLFVDADGAPSTQDGSLANPYLTIQAAVNAVGYPITVADSAKDWIILIAPGDYDESVTIKGPVRLALIGLGAFRLGRYTVAGVTQSNIVPVDGGVRRNLVWIYHNPQMIPGGAAPQLVIGTIGGMDVVRPGKPIANRISGAIIVRGGGWIAQNGTINGPKGGTAFLAIANTQVDAGITATQNPASPTAINALSFNGILVDRHFNSRFRGEILGPLNGKPATAPAYVLASSFMSQYEQLVQVSQYASIQQAGFERGMIVSQVPKLGTLLSVVPPGLVNSTFAGVFKFEVDPNLPVPQVPPPPPPSPVGSLLLDATTNTWFIRNNATLAGGATKSFLGGASQTLAIQAAKTLQDSDCGVTLLADATGGSFSVLLPSAVGKDDLTFTIKNIGTLNNVTVKPAPGETIDGMNNLALVPPLGLPSVIKIVAHSGKWWIVAQG